MTKNEFFDVVGGIDSRLIESTLDQIRAEEEYTSFGRPEVLRPDENKGSGALKYIICAAACVAVVFTAFVFLKNRNEITISIPYEAESSEIISDNNSGIDPDLVTSDPFEPEYFFDLIRVTPEYLEHTDESVIKVKVELMDIVDSIREAYEKEYEGVEIDPYNDPWNKFLAAAMADYFREFMADHDIDYDELKERGDVHIFIPQFTCELEKNAIMQLLDDERVFVIVIPDENSPAIVDF